ncbi:MAG: 50S ribosomal protein L9, partial [Nitrospinae bacterium]|nr:50S ribosomal protein L9 [Nitrospinota bacterium]
LSAQQNKHLRQATHLAVDINTISATFVRKAGEDDKLFGSVTSKDIADFFAEEKMGVERKNVLLEEPIKSLGVFNVPIKLHPEVEVELKVWVVKE